VHSIVTSVDDALSWGGRAPLGRHVSNNAKRQNCTKGKNAQQDAI